MPELNSKHSDACTGSEGSKAAMTDLIRTRGRPKLASQEVACQRMSDHGDQPSRDDYLGTSCWNIKQQHRQSQLSKQSVI